MVNELLFFLQVSIMGIFALVCLRLGQTALTCFVTVSCILANLFVVKQITLCGLTATASDAYSIGAVLGLNLIQEYYGREKAQKAIVISFALLIFYCLVSQFHLAYSPCMSDSMDPHYQAILSFMPRIIIASLFVYATIQYIDALFYSSLKKLSAGRYLVPRNIITLSVCQLLDTVLFSYIGLYGIVNNIGEIIIVSYGIKLAAIALSIPFIAFSKKIFTR